MKKFYLFFCLLFSINISFSQDTETIFTGDATFYNYTGGGNCSFPYPYTKIYSAALNAPQYRNSELCGACAEVTGPRGKFIVSIQDQCPECHFGDLDFEAAAFPLIADPIEGRVRISWKIVNCPLEGPVTFHFKKGSHQYWNAVQVRNHRYPIAKFEYRNPTGNYVEVTKLNYNYFVESSGMGVGPYDFRITDIYGQVIESKNITFLEDGTVPGNSQFPLVQITGTAKMIDEKNFQVYPNPLIERKSKLINSSHKEMEYELYDLSGHLIEKARLKGLSEKTIELESSGTYILKSIEAGEIIGFEKLFVY